MPRKPVYQQIIDDITASIRAGVLKPGDKLPSIAELRAQYDASDTPVKRALWALDMQGWIESHQGKGSFVTAEPPA